MNLYYYQKFCCLDCLINEYQDYMIESNFQLPDYKKNWIDAMHNHVNKDNFCLVGYGWNCQKL